MIYMVVRFDKKNYVFSTKVKVYPYHWDKEAQEAIRDISLCKLDNLNNTMANRAFPTPVSEGQEQNHDVENIEKKDIVAAQRIRCIRI